MVWGLSGFACLDACGYVCSLRFMVMMHQLEDTCSKLDIPKKAGISSLELQQWVWQKQAIIDVLNIRRGGAQEKSSEYNKFFSQSRQILILIRTDTDRGAASDPRREMHPRWIVAADPVGQLLGLLTSSAGVEVLDLILEWAGPEMAAVPEQPLATGKP